MRVFAALGVFVCLVLTAPTAGAGRVVHVKDPAFCHGATWCDEWRFPERPDLRVVRQGFEDGVDTRIYKVDKRGNYTPVIDIEPVVRDASGQFWEAHIDRMIDMPYQGSAKTLRLWVTFEREFSDGPESCRATWMKRVPSVLFTAPGVLGPGDHSDEPDARRHTFVKMSLERMIALAKKRPRGPIQMNCDDKCCAFERRGR